MSGFALCPSRLKIFCGSPPSCLDNSFASDSDPPPENSFLTYNHTILLTKVEWMTVYSIVLLICCNKKFNFSLLSDPQMVHACGLEIH